MTTAAVPARTAPTHRPVLVGVYLALSVAGLVATWWFNLSFIAAGGGDHLTA